MDVIMNPPVLRKSNNTLKPFKRNSHFDADNTKDSDNSLLEIKSRSKRINMKSRFSKCNLKNLS